MKISYLIRGLPGHPLHPPLTDVTVGLYTGATAFAVLSKLGVSEGNLAHAWWILLVAGLVVTVPTALTGLAEWLTISREAPLWRTATAHLLAMVTATVFFLIAAIAGHGGYVDAKVGGGSLVLTLIGFGLLTFGGWLGGAIVFTHGMRVLKLVSEPAVRAVIPRQPEKERAEQERVKA
jgi:uncharacterized membrane protein